MNLEIFKSLAAQGTHGAVGYGHVGSSSSVDVRTSGRLDLGPNLIEYIAGDPEGLLGRDSLEVFGPRGFALPELGPIGANGFIYESFQDYVVQARSWGIKLDTRAYTDEAVAAKDFKAGECDMAAVTGIRTIQFVLVYASSIKSRSKSFKPISTPRSMLNKRG